MLLLAFRRYQHLNKSFAAAGKSGADGRPFTSTPNVESNIRKRMSADFA
jgi:hypothetical protein